MMAEVNQALEGIDLLAVMVDASAGLTREDRLAFERARQFRRPVFLLLNKIDRIAKPALLPLIEACSKELSFTEIIPVSALTGDGVDLALERLIAHLPEGEPYFPKDQVTDQPERFLAAEIVREKAMSCTKQEVPHAVAVRIEAFEESPKLVRIQRDYFRRARGAEGNTHRQRRRNAKGNRHGGAPGTRRNSRDKGFPGIACEGRSGLAPRCAQGAATRLAAPTRAAGKRIATPQRKFRETSSCDRDGCARGPGLCAVLVIFH